MTTAVELYERYVEGDPTDTLGDRLATIDYIIQAIGASAEQMLERISEGSPLPLDDIPEIANYAVVALHLVDKIVEHNIGQSCLRDSFWPPDPPATGRPYYRDGNRDR